MTQYLLIKHLDASSPCKTPMPELVHQLGVNVYTLRNSLYKFKARGWVTTGRWRVGTKQGTTATLRRDKVPGEIWTALAGDSPVESLVKSLVKSLIHHSEQPPSVDREIKDKNLSISQEELSLCWPKLSAVGWGISPVTQILSAGKAMEDLREDMNRIEYELKSGVPMKDKDGHPVKSLVGYFFTACLAGPYRRPEGYMTMQERVRADKLAELERLDELDRQIAEKLSGRWWKGLTEEEQAEAKKGRATPNTPEAILGLWKANGSPGL